jgi:hypothetical protein
MNGHMHSIDFFRNKIYKFIESRKFYLILRRIGITRKRFGLKKRRRDYVEATNGAVRPVLMRERGYFRERDVL